MCHRTDSTDVLKQFHIRSGIAESIVPDNRGNRLTTELAVTGRIDMFIETGLDNFR